MTINHAERAFHVWPILARVAKQPDPTITYGELAAEIGIHHRAVRYVLSEIQDYCLADKLPPLTILVVNAGDRLPGEGFVAWDADDLTAGVEKVVRYPWSQLVNPFSYAASGHTEEELADKLVNSPSTAGDVYALVKVRGTAQSIFRKALLLAYGSRCAICGLSFEAALDAAHLIPWSAASHEQRMSPTNGVLLCSTHHSLFDTGLITISAEFAVAFYDPNGVDGHYSEADRKMSILLHSKPAFMPTDVRHHPTQEALAHHHRLHEWDFSAYK